MIAHSLTVTMLHLTAARLAVGRGNTDDATEALEEAEQAGRRSLADVRRTIGLLRRTTDGGERRTALAPAAGRGRRRAAGRVRRRRLRRSP